MAPGTGKTVSQAFLISSLLAFVVFHLLPVTGVGRGWEIWKIVWEVFRTPSQLSDPPSMLFLASLCTVSVLIPASPFLRPVWRKSKLAWMLVLPFSGLVACAFLYFFYDIMSSDLTAGLGIPFAPLFFAPTLNFIGLLFARVGAPRPMEFPGESGSPPQL